METVLQDLSLAALAAANRANLFAGMVYLGRSPAADYRQGPPLTWMLSGIPGSFLNQVYVESMRADDAGNHQGDPTIAEALAYFRARNVSATSWWARPGVKPAALGRQLEAHGMAFSQDDPGMATDLLAVNGAVPLPAGLTIELVRDDDKLRLFADTAETGFEAPAPFGSRLYELYRGLGYDPPLLNYLGFVDGKPVATSGLFLGAGVACVITVATVPDARRQGIGMSMTLAAMKDARALGYRIAVLQASSMGLHLYERLGFREVCRMSHWEWRDSRQ